MCCEISEEGLAGFAEDSLLVFGVLLVVAQGDEHVDLAEDVVVDLGAISFPNAHERPEAVEVFRLLFGDIGDVVINESRGDELVNLLAVLDASSEFGVSRLTSDRSHLVDKRVKAGITRRDRTHVGVVFVHKVVCFHLLQETAPSVACIVLSLGSFNVSCALVVADQVGFVITLAKPRHRRPCRVFLDGQILVSDPL